MVTWGSDPQFKVEAGATDLSSDTFTVTVHRPENAISRVLISANDFEGKHYIANIDTFTVIKVSLRYGAGGWTQVFEGVVERVGPKLDTKQTVELTAYGYGRALRNTHCVANYGAESEDPSLNTPHEIWDDIIAEMVNKSFGGVATGYGILDAKVAPAANPSINFIEGGYRNNYTMINDILTIYQGFRAGASGMHWFVDESKNLFINTIAAHENDATGWPTWWRTNQAGSTLVEGVDFTNTIFSKNTGNFANKVVLYCDLRKPGTDWWTEDNGPVWGIANGTATYSAAQQTVGSHSLLIEPNAQPAAVYAYYPSTGDAAWDFTRIGSEKSIPKVNWYEYITTTNMTARTLLFFEDLAALGGAHVDNYFALWNAAGYTVPSNINEWVHFSYPFGPYWQTDTENRQFNWQTVGGPPAWSLINGICLALFVPTNNNHDTYVDDLHLSGKIIREAYNSTSITAYDEVQKIMRHDTAIDDSLKPADGSGTAGYLAYGELLARQVIPVTGVIVTSIAEDALPGQLIYIKADAHAPFGANDYRVRDTFRVKEVIHTFADRATTTWDVTSDVLNTFVPGLNNALSTYHKIIHTDPDMKNLRTTGLDPYVSRLSIDYP